jgi:hypothetical protein
MANTAETTEWVAANLRKAEHVTQVEVLSDRMLRVSREKHASYVAGIVSVKCVKADDIQPIVESEFGVEIIANVPRESYWTGQALSLARANGIATGAYGDLLRVIDVKDVRAFQQKETVFIERGLRQHNRIANFERVHDRLYLIRRNGLTDIMVAMLNEYELTADHLRTARDRYGQFSLAVITDPNRRATNAANEAAQTMGVEILKWGAFFGRLNGK